MAESSPAGSNTAAGEAADDPMAAFGANEWLVDEMYEQYKRDPDSVDKAWWAFFKERSAREQGAGTSGDGATQQTQAAPRAEQPAQAKQADQPQQPKQSQAAPQQTQQKTEQPAQPKPATPKKTTPAKDVQPRPDDPKAAKPQPTGPVPKDPEPAVKPEVSDEPELTPLRGAPARTAQNMDLSLTVPTATSVRSVPVKLLIDNRIVINNHLARARGGKVSFTHLIGYALVKALKDMPEMNNGFDVIDGKPTLIKPKHVNLGLAIDMAKPDGTRQLLVPSIKAAESKDIATFWTA